MRSTLFLLALLQFGRLLFCVDGFVVPAFPNPSTIGITHCNRRSYDSNSCFALAAKKKRRRRKVVEQAPTTAPDETASEELPDFDLEGDDASSNSLASASRVVDGATITPNMMSTKQARGASSLGDLLKDRSLEAKFEFDSSDKVAEDLPDLLAPQFQQQQPRKKKIQAAVARAQQEQESGNPLTQLPFLLNEKGQVSGVKILEAGAWLGIGLLVLWEFYINSPLFERAAPIIPVVYDIVL